MPPTTQPVDPSAPKPAHVLTIAPMVTDEATGALYVHQDYNKQMPNWQVAEHTGPVATTEKLGDVESWCNYVLRYATYDPSETLLTWNEHGFRATLDYHLDIDNPGRCTWKANHDFVRSHQWNRWAALANGQPRTQKQVLEALEDYSEDIAAPDPAALLAILRTLRATASATADTELMADGSTKVVWSKQTGVGPKNADLEIPSEFQIAVPVLKGHTTVDPTGKVIPVVYALPVRVRVSVDDQAHLAIRLSMPTADRTLEAVFADRVAAATAHLGTNHRIYRAAGGRDPLTER